jgi:hypothetical protein
MHRVGQPQLAIVLDTDGLELRAAAVLSGEDPSGEEHVELVAFMRALVQPDAGPAQRSAAQDAFYGRVVGTVSELHPNAWISAFLVGAWPAPANRFRGHPRVERALFADVVVDFALAGPPVGTVELRFPSYYVFAAATFNAGRVRAPDLGLTTAEIMLEVAGQLCKEHVDLFDGGDVATRIPAGEFEDVAARFGLPPQAVADAGARADRAGNAEWLILLVAAMGAC